MKSLPGIQIRRLKHSILKFESIHGIINNDEIFLKKSLRAHAYNITTLEFQYMFLTLLKTLKHYLLKKSSDAVEANVFKISTKFISSVDYGPSCIKF